MVTGEKKKLSKVPSLAVPSDSLAIEADGETYYPHAGETVTFRGRQTVGDALLALRLQSVNGESDPERIAETMQSVVEGLAKRIVAWTWTDDDGTAYPSPPTADVVASLSFAELGWLVGGGQGKGDDLPNE